MVSGSIADHPSREAAVFLIVIDTQAETVRTVRVPLRAIYRQPHPAQVLPYRPRA